MYRDSQCSIVSKQKGSRNLCTLCGNDSMSIVMAIPWEILEALRKNDVYLFLLARDDLQDADW